MGLGRLAIVAAKAEEGMRHHDQSHMPVQSSPEAAFIVVQPQFPLGVLVESFDDPSAVSQGHQVMEGEGVQTPGEEIFGLSLMPWQGALPDEPTCNGEGLASATNPGKPSLE